MRKYNVGGFERVSKQAARRIFNAGGVVYLCPVNLRPGAPWNPQTGVKNSPNGGGPADFDYLVLAFTAYHCRNSETGRYLAFYVREGGAQV